LSPSASHRHHRAGHEYEQCEGRPVDEAGHDQELVAILFGRSSPGGQHHDHHEERQRAQADDGGHAHLRHDQTGEAGNVDRVCTVLIRFDPAAPWPVLLAAVRDEFADRPWDSPGAHWPDHPHLLGGRDRLAGGTWLAVDPTRPAVAALLNGVPRGPLEGGGARPTRGALALRALLGEDPPTGAALTDYDRFHLLRATAGRAEVWTWDGVGMVHRPLAPGDHILVNAGVDEPADPLVPHFAPLLAATPSPDPKPDQPTEQAWPGWVDLLLGDGLDPTDPRALIVAHDVGGRRYGSSSVCLVGLGRGAVRYDFSSTPGRQDGWTVVDVG
jgi:hypothetical protein